MATLGTFTAGQVLTAAELNAIGTWTTFTPVFKFGTNTATMGGATGRYTVINDLLIVTVLGNTFTYSGSGALYVDLPAAAGIAAISGFGAPRIGFGSIYNGGAGVGYEITAYRASQTQLGFTGDGYGVVSNTAPITFGASTELYATIVTLAA